ncbi:MAG TPA: nitroreductase/quinone reductase family protein [Blastocatellia bacterium]|nr:nitroreductase/quinone reductase family protein [Blastocatellia bacterium]
MFAQEMTRLENEFYRGLNRVVEPMVRAGVGSPVLWPTGAIVLETTGRTTGRTHRVPLLVTRVGDLLLVSTVRRRSQWLENLAANPEARYWLAGRAHEATAFVIAQGQNAPLEEMPPLARCLANLLIPQSSLFGVSFAILQPR